MRDDNKYKPVKDMTDEEFDAWMKSPYDPADPRISYDHEAWLQTSALLEQRRALDDMERQNANAPDPIALKPSSEPSIGGFADTPDPRFPRRKSK